MYRYSFPDDPNYRSDPAVFVRDAVRELLSYDIVSDPSLTTRLLEIDQRKQVIKVQPGHSFRRFHRLVDRASLYVAGGSAWAPEFHVQTNLRLVSDVPAPRTPSTLDHRPGTGEHCPHCRQALGGG